MPDGCHLRTRIHLGHGFLVVDFVKAQIANGSNEAGTQELPGAHILFHHRQAAQFLHQAQIEHHLTDPARYFVHGPRGFLAGDRIDRHQQQIAAVAFLNDRQNGRIGTVATVPIVFTVYGDGRKIHRQAG